MSPVRLESTEPDPSSIQVDRDGERVKTGRDEAEEADEDGELLEMMWKRDSEDENRSNGRDEGLGSER